VIVDLEGFVSAGSDMGRADEREAHDPIGNRAKNEGTANRGADADVRVSCSP
jgi:hypothetical protein